MRRFRFDTLGKLTTAHCAGAPTVHGQWVCPRTVGASASLNATGGGPPTVRGHTASVAIGQSDSPPCRGSINCPLTVGGPPPVAFRLADSPNERGTPTVQWVPLHSGQGSPSSLLRPYIADTSALLMLELGLMPVVTTMPWAKGGGR